MALRVCLEPDCPTLTKKSRCKAHERAKDAARGTRQQRGYDSAHDRLRADWQRKLDAGQVIHCWRCKARGVTTVIDPKHWHLGHDDHDRSVYRGPECPPCNLATAGRTSPHA